MREKRKCGVTAKRPHHTFLHATATGMPEQLQKVMLMETSFT